VILPVFLLFSHGQSVSEQLQVLIYPFLSPKCRELHLRVFFKQKLEFFPSARLSNARIFAKN